MEKKCCTCKKLKPFADFNKLKKGKYGLQHRCRLCHSKKNKEYWKNNNLTEVYRYRSYLDSEKDRKRSWRLNNKDYYRKYKKENKGRINFLNTKRRIAKKQSSIFISHYKDSILEIYNLATKDNNQVDHIIPILHKNVCGLHVPWNLQILTPKENNYKNNKFDGTYDNNSWRIEYAQENK